MKRFKGFVTKTDAHVDSTLPVTGAPGPSSLDLDPDSAMEIIGNEPKMDVDKGDQDYLYIGLDAAILILKMVKEVAEAIPLVSSPLKASCGTMISILETIKGCKRNRMEWEALAVAIKDKSEFIKDALQMAQTDYELHKFVSKQVVKYKSKLDEIADDISAHADGSCPKKSRKVEWFWHRLKQGIKEAAIWNIDAERISSYKEEILSLTLESVLAMNFQAAQASSNALIVVNEMRGAIQSWSESTRIELAKSQMILENLEARFSSQESTLLLQRLATSPLANGDFHQRCMSGTRQGILHEAKEWAKDPSAPQIFWLTDVAGSGKSTIANELARDWNQEGKLAGRFFFSRDAEETRTSKLFFTTIAQQGLSRLSPRIRTLVANGVYNLGDPVAATLQEQHFELFVTPLEAMMAIAVLVIDAIDECEPRTCDIMLPLLFSNIPNIPLLKIFITSRPEPRFDSSIGMTRHIEHSVSRSKDQNLYDVERFLTHHLQAHLTSVQLSALIERADGLFIWAATACKAIIGSIFEPYEIMEQLLGTEFNNLDSLYATALASVFTGQEKKVALRILEVIVAANEPLSPSSIDLLLGRTKSHLFVRKMGSVLQSGGYEDPVRFLHETFREYLICNRGSDDYYIDESNAHCSLARGCLRLMLKELRYNICELDELAQEIDQIADVNGLVSTHISPPLIYACRSWGLHTVAAFASRATPLDNETGLLVINMFTQKFLDWVYVLSVLGQLYEASVTINQLTFLSQRPEVDAWLNECRLLLRAHYQILRKCPLAAYTVALPFSSRNSLTWHIYSRSNKMLYPIVTTPRVLIEPTFFRIEIPAQPLKITTSANGDWVAIVGSKVSLWNVRTGTSLQWSHCAHLSCTTTHVSFHETPLRLCTGCLNGLSCWWDVMKIVSDPQPIEKHELKEAILAWSEDGRLALSKSSQRALTVIELTENKRTTLHASSTEEISRFRHFKFSPAGGNHISVRINSTTWIWDSCTGILFSISSDIFRFSSIGSAFALCDQPKSPNGVHSVVKFYTIHGSALTKCWESKIKAHIHDIQFLCKQQRLAAVTRSHILLYDTNTGKLIYTFQVNVDQRTVNFSPSGRYIAVKRDGKIELRDLWVATFQKVLEAPGSWDTTFPFFSSDSRHILAKVISGTKATVYMWPLESYNPAIALSEQQSGTITSMTFSKDNSLLTSGEQDGTVRIWDTRSGQHETFKYLSCKVEYLEFSSDSLYLLVTSKLTIVIIDLIQRSAITIFSMDPDNACDVAVLFPRTIRAASLHRDHTLRIHARPATVLNLRYSSHQFESASVSPDESIIAFSSSYPSFEIFCLDWQAPALLFRTSIEISSTPLVDRRLRLAFRPEGIHLIVMSCKSYRGDTQLFCWTLGDSELQLCWDPGLRMDPISSSTKRDLIFFNDGISLAFHGHGGAKFFNCVDNTLTPLHPTVFDHRFLSLRYDESTNYVMMGNVRLFEMPAFCHPREGMSCCSGSYIAAALQSGDIVIIDCSWMVQKALEITEHQHRIDRSQALKHRVTNIAKERVDKRTLRVTDGITAKGKVSPEGVILDDSSNESTTDSDDSEDDNHDGEDNAEIMDNNMPRFIIEPPVD